MTNHDRWDPSQPGLFIAILWVLIALGAIATTGSVLLARDLVGGVVAGAVIAIMAFFAALQAGRAFRQSQRFAPVMFWLLSLQALVWIGMALLLMVVKVHPVGFAIGVSILPIGIILTVFWYWILWRGWQK